MFGVIYIQYLVQGVQGYSQSMKLFFFLHSCFPTFKDELFSLPNQLVNQWPNLKNLSDGLN